MDIVAQRIQRIKLSPSVARRRIVAELREQGRRIIDLTVGEPDFNTPDHIGRAALAAIEEGDTKYPPAQGTSALRQAVRKRFIASYGVDYPIDQILVGTGAKQVLYNALAASLNDGDEVIIPAPFWVSYPDMVVVNGGTPTLVSCHAGDNYKLTAASLESAITPATKWLLMNSPSNPTGALYSHDEIRSLANVLLQHPHVWLMTDDIYSQLNFTSEPTSHFLHVAPELKERTLVVDGVSKAYAMTGWRIGFGAGPKVLIQAMTTLQSQSTSGASSISQAAALQALTGPQECVGQFVDAYKTRCDVAMKELSRINELQLVQPQGAFYIFPDCSALLGKTTPDGLVLATDTDFCNYLLRESGVAVIDGTAYGAPGTFRLSFAASLSDIQEGCQGIAQAIQRLK